MADIAKESLNLESDAWTGNTNLNNVDQNEVADAAKKAKELTDAQAAKDAADAAKILENLNKKSGGWRSEKANIGIPTQNTKNTYNQLSHEDQHAIDNLPRSEGVKDGIKNSYLVGQNDFNNMTGDIKKVLNALWAPFRAIWKLFTWSTKKE